MPASGNGYGLTETSSVATFLPHEYARHAARDGRLRRARGRSETGSTWSTSGDVGELLIRGPNVVAGYWSKPEATAETFAGGWLHTGDLARLDADGFVQIVDRKKDMVNRGGENVYCVEVENALAAHPAVFEVAVLGVPDPMMGEKVGAIVVIRPGESLDPHDLVAFAAKSLADFKIPVRGGPPGPATAQAGGKVLKATLRTDRVARTPALTGRPVQPPPQRRTMSCHHWKP